MRVDLRLDFRVDLEHGLVYSGSLIYPYEVSLKHSICRFILEVW